MLTTLPELIAKARTQVRCLDAETAIKEMRETCATGGRATLAAEQLKRLGYNRVTVITCSADIVRQHQEPIARWTKVDETTLSG